jgi:hypothetical protein
MELRISSVDNSIGVTFIPLKLMPPRQTTCFWGLRRNVQFQDPHTYYYYSDDYTYGKRNRTKHYSVNLYKPSLLCMVSITGIENSAFYSIISSTDLYFGLDYFRLQNRRQSCLVGEKFEAGNGRSWEMNGESIPVPTETSSNDDKSYFESLGQVSNLPFRRFFFMLGSGEDVGRKFIFELDTNWHERRHNRNLVSLSANWSQMDVPAFLHALETIYNHFYPEKEGPVVVSPK